MKRCVKSRNEVEYHFATARVTQRSPFLLTRTATVRCQGAQRQLTLGWRECLEIIGRVTVLLAEHFEESLVIAGHLAGIAFHSVNEIVKIV